MSGARLAAVSGGVCAFLLGIVLLTYLIPHYVPKPPYAGGDAPGPQAFPRVIAWGFVILGGLDVVFVYLSREKVQWQVPEALGRLFLVAALLVAALLAMPYAGMLPVGTVLVIAITILASGQKIVPSVLTAVLFTGAVYLIFVLVAGIPLPAGSLWE